MQSNEQTVIKVEGHIKIWDPIANEIFIDMSNAIHFEHFSIALANGITNSGQQYIYKMVFGNGGTSVDPTGIITYLTPNSFGPNSSLYNETYSKIINNNSADNIDPTKNYLTIAHTTGNNYTDIQISFLLDYGEPSNQNSYNTTPDGEQSYVFDELGLQSYDQNGNNMLLTHAVFHPVQKILNRLVQIDYTVRIQVLSVV